MKFFKFYIYLFISFFFSCTSSKVLDRQNLIGTWNLTSTQINYPAIKFEKESEIAWFHSQADTLYFFKYKLKKNVLILTDNNGKRTENIITSLNRDTLVFQTLLENKASQIYVRAE